MVPTSSLEPASIGVEGMSLTDDNAGGEADRLFFRTLRRRIPWRFALLLLGLASFLYFMPTGFFLTLPGSAEDVAPMVNVEGQAGGGGGQVMLTTVRTQEANLALYLFGRVWPRAELRPRENFLAPGEDFEDYLDRTDEMMDESQAVAKLVALRQLGYEARMSGDGVEVLSVMEEAPSASLLQPEDIIVEAGGRPTPTVDALLSLLAEHQPGDEIRLVYQRDGELKRVDVQLMEHPSEPGRAIIGLGVATKNVSYQFPVDIDIDAGAIGGPSAGLAFTLEIIDRLTPESDLTGNRKVACTGTINAQGKVGRIGGVQMKVWAAEAAGADVFLVPPGNYEDAVGAASRMEVVRVGTIEEALSYLGTGR